MLGHDGRRENAPGALLLLDLDNFKPLHDEQGHAAGDTLLREVAHRLHGCVRETDTVARLGGDEFGVLLPALDQDPAVARKYATDVAEKVVQSLGRPYHLDVGETGQAIEHRCCCSVGVTLFSGHETSESLLIKRANAAMYQAKQPGRNRIVLATARVPLVPAPSSRLTKRKE